MQLSNIKKEREDLEKLVNNFRSIIYKTITVLLLASGMIYSQDVYRKGGTYVIDTITVVGLENFSDRTVVTYSGLREGQSIQMPGEEISTILKKLWNLELFSNVDLYITDIKGSIVKVLHDNNLSKKNGVLFWDGTNNFGLKVNSGMYFYTLETSHHKKTKKMLLLK